MHVCVHVSECVTVCSCIYMRVSYNYYIHMRSLSCVHVYKSILLSTEKEGEYPTSLWACVTTLYGGHDLCNDIHIQRGFTYIAAASTCISALQYMMGSYMPTNSWALYYYTLNVYNMSVCWYSVCHGGCMCV